MGPQTDQGQPGRWPAERITREGLNEINHGQAFAILQFRQRPRNLGVDGCQSCKIYDVVRYETVVAQTFEQGSHIVGVVRDGSTAIAIRYGPVVEKLGPEHPVSSAQERLLSRRSKLGCGTVNIGKKQNALQRLRLQGGRDELWRSCLLREKN